MSTLANIIIKFRRITKNPSTTQITDAQVQDYINTFYLYDFPEHLRQDSLRSNYEFFTTPYIDRYDFPSDLYVSVEQPVYVDGYQSYFTESYEQFFRIYPQIDIIQTLATGNGTAGPYVYIAPNIPIIQRTVSVSAVTNSGNTLKAYDTPLDQTLFPNIGEFTGDVVNPSTIQYVSGGIQVTFSQNIAAGTAIKIHYSPYVASRPSSVLFWQNRFYLRPVPDDCYRVSIVAYQTPSQLLLTTDSPLVKQWWQAIALGASLKYFEDVGDLEQIVQYRPLFDEQMALIERRTLQNIMQQQAATIYSDQTSVYSNWSYYGNF